MARVNVEQKALTDPRFELLGQMLGSNRFEALGRMLLVWHECQERGSYILTEKLLGIIMGSPKGVEWLIESDLAERDEAGVRIKGTEGRIEWLEAKRTQARKNGGTGGRPKNQQRTKSEPMLVSDGTNHEPTPGASGFPSETPLALVPPPALAPAPPKPPAGVCIRPDDFDELIKAWNGSQLPNAGKVSRDPTRVGFWQMRLADEYWREHWREGLARANKSDRARGLVKGWAGLFVDTFLKDPGILRRILEGEFDNPGANRPPPEPTVFTDPNNLPTNEYAPPAPKKERAA